MLWQFAVQTCVMNILLLNGNNERHSLSAAICEAYKQGAEQAGHTVALVHIGQLQFDAILHEGYHTIQNLEPGLLDFQQKVLWCHHFVIVYPTWWGGMPAQLTGLFDRCFYSGFAYKYHDKGLAWDKLLKGRSAHIITTMDAPYAWYLFAYRSAGTNMLKHAILKFCGFSPVKTDFITRVRYKSAAQLQKEIDQIRMKAVHFKKNRHKPVAAPIPEHMTF